jgi:hypothetical protein
MYRAISLKTCFNINRRQDTKHRHVITLYTKDDCFGLVLDCEEELEEWLKALLSLQHGEDIVDGEEPKPTFGESCFWAGSRLLACACARVLFLMTLWLQSTCGK